MGKMKDLTIPEYDQHSHDPTADQSSDDDAINVQKSQSQTLKMYSHDPLCPNAERFEISAVSACFMCVVIDGVRKDERTRTLEEAIGIITDMREDHIRWYRVALQDAAEALYELRHTAPPVDTTQ
jgi:hypothetical protein